MSAAGDSNRPLSAQEFAAVTGVSRETRERLSSLAELLIRWQKRINLVGNDTLADLWRRHILDSAQLVPLLPEHCRVVTDLGSGAGFPGLVVAILTGCETHLVEADTRKCAFLREAARVARVPTKIHASRIEELVPWRTDVVTARALAPLATLLNYARRFDLGNGNQPICLFLKGKNAQQELTEAQKEWIMRFERFPSRSDSQGSILRISAFSPREPHDQGVDRADG